MIINPGMEKDQGCDVGLSMAGQTVEPTEGSVVTAGEGAEIFNDYQARTFSADEGSDLVKPKQGNVASGKRAHAEGGATTASGQNSHAEGYGTTASGSASHAEGGSFAGNYVGSKATAYAAHAEGISTEASGRYSHAEGDRTTASGQVSHAEGIRTKATGRYSHAEGEGSEASGYNSHAEGSSTKAEASYSHVQGNGSIASGYASSVAGNGTISEYLSETAVGRFNLKKNPIDSTTSGDLFVVGKGSVDYQRANAFRVDITGVYGTSTFNISGADYAELFQWLDGNPNMEDRCGRFVTLDGEKIRLAGPADDFILGIVSGAPSVVGDVYDDQWQGMFLTDVFGRPTYEDVWVPDETIERPDPEDPEKTVTEVISPAHMERRQKINPAYDSTQTYQPRTQRPEWAAVGMLGKLVAVDDGTCQVNGWCTAGEDGAATCSAQRTRYRVMARLDENHVRVLIV